MTYALDTNTISFLLRPSKNQQIVQMFENIIKQGDDYVIPPLSYYEVYWYLIRKNATAQLKVFLDLYNSSSAKIYMNEDDFQLAARIKAQLVKDGTPIGNKDADIFIAAYCINNNYALVTDNVSDFKRIADLKYVNWV